MNSSLIQQFRQLLKPENVLTDPADRFVYGYDAAVLEPVTPGIVLIPQTIDDLGACVRLLHEHGIPQTVRGAGTNLSGGSIPCSGGAVIVTNALNRILEINEADMYARVEPGVITAKLAAAVEKTGLFYPPDPGSQAVSTLGGNVAENAGGLRGLKYGVTKDYVMGLEFFDVQGNLIRTGSKTVKCATGYNLAGLMIGSEGTLGVMSEIILKLIPYPASRKSMIAIFDRMEAASETVAEIIRHRIVPATLEFMDNFTIRAVESHAKAGLPIEAGALLLIEVDGHSAQVQEEAERTEVLCRRFGASSIRVAQNDAERNSVWEARRSALSALAKLKPTVVLEDATVPRSKIPDMVRALADIAQTCRLDIGVFGHAGDGNLHPTILTDKRNAEEWRRVEEAIDAIFDKALSLGGTLSGEHGTGMAKSKYLVNETGTGAILFAKKIKAAVDPNNLLNPGKIIG